MKTNISEYCEEMEVEILELDQKNDREWIIKAYNEAGCNWTEVDLVDVLRFVKKEMPELWETI